MQVIEIDYLMSTYII